MWVHSKFIYLFISIVIVCKIGPIWGLWFGYPLLMHILGLLMDIELDIYYFDA